jgi:hypothetical protein
MLSLIKPRGRLGRRSEEVEYWLALTLAPSFLLLVVPWFTCKDLTLNFSVMIVMLFCWLVALWSTALSPVIRRLFGEVQEWACARCLLILLLWLLTCYIGFEGCGLVVTVKYCLVLALLVCFRWMLPYWFYRYPCLCWYVPLW